MQITLRIQASHRTGPAATRAEVTEQLAEQVASIAQFAVEHSATGDSDDSDWADYTIDAVHTEQDSA